MSENFIKQLNNIARDFRYTSIQTYPHLMEAFEQMVNDFRFDIREIFRTSNNCDMKTMLRHIVKLKDDRANFGNIFKESEFYDLSARLAQLEWDIIDAIPDILRNKCNCR